MKVRERICDLCRGPMGRRGDLIIKQRWISWADTGWDRKDICVDCTEKLINFIEIHKTNNTNKHEAEWIGVEGDGYADGHIVYDVWQCSNCGNEEFGDEVPAENPYCRHCGAKMSTRW